MNRLTSFSHVLAPGRIAGLQLDNRVLLPAMDMNLCEEGYVSDGEIAHYRARAAGGTAMVITGTGAVAWPVGATSRHQPAFSSDDYIPGLKRLADAIHEVGGKLCMQMCHHGKVASVDTADGRPVVERYRAWQPRATASADAGGWVTYRYEVLSPYAALLTKQADDAAGGIGAGVQDSYTIWACPTTDETCRLWFAQYTTDTVSSDESLRAFQTTIFSQDQPVLESQRPRRLPVSEGAPREVATAADRLSMAYRRYLREQGLRIGVC